MVQTERTITINDTDRKMAQLAARLSDREIFAIKCFLTGFRAGKDDKEDENRQQAAQGAAV